MIAAIWLKCIYMLFSSLLLANIPATVNAFSRVPNSSLPYPKQKLLAKFEYASIPVIPVLGNPPQYSVEPLYGKHNGKNDAVFALACKYPKEYFQRFVGSLRKFGYPGDVVLAVSPPDQMKPGVGEYLQLMNVIAYAFDVDCNGKDSCRLKDEFLGYPDPRDYRTFAHIRYALYEYWIRYYNEQSYILILDFRDTFFQADPFQSFGYPVINRVAKYDLQVYAENHKVSLFRWTLDDQCKCLFLNCCR